MVPDVVCELRSVVFYDRAHAQYRNNLVYLCEDEGRCNGFSLTTHLTMSAERALEVCFLGDTGAQEAAHTEVQRLTGCWIQWLLAECPEPQPQVRLDFLVAY